MSTLRFAPAVAAYLERHAIDSDLAHDLGVRSDRETIVYPYARRDGTTFTRRRDLNDPEERTKQPADEPLIPYFPTGRPESGADVLVCEGEPDTLAARTALKGRESAPTVCGLPGTSTPVATVAAELGQARRVYLGLDNDEPGRKAADGIARALQGHVELRVVQLEDDHDLADALAAADDPAAWLVEALEQAPPAPKLRTRPSSGGYSQSVGASTEAERKSAATQLVDLAREGASFFHSPDELAYAILTAAEHEEVWKLRSKRFRAWLARRYYDTQAKAPGAQALQDAINVLEGVACFDGEAEAVHLRIAEHGGRIYLDLGDETWRAVEISSEGWSLVSRPPVRFRRPAGLAALPAPVRGGSVEDMRPFLNLADEQDWTLNTAWLIAALRPVGPYPVLELVGEQGTAKSTHARLARSVIDPATSPLRRPPRDGRDLMIAASNGWVVALDNLSELREWLADDLCRLATGGGFATRQLYTDDDEVIFDAMRPIVLTGIGGVSGDRGDLLDRVVLINKPRIPPHQRRDEERMLLDFERVRPRILGALLDAVVVALGRVEQIEFKELPRMADFARWATAAEPALGWPDGTFLAAYDERRSQTHELALEASPIAPEIRAIALDGGFEGTASELLDRLADGSNEAAARELPKNAAKLGKDLRRLAPDLRGVGLVIEFSEDRHGTPIRITAQPPVSPVSPVQEGADRHGTHGTHGISPTHSPASTRDGNTIAELGAEDLEQFAADAGIEFREEVA